MGQKWNYIFIGHFLVIMLLNIFSYIILFHLCSLGIVWSYPLITVFMCYLSVRVANPLLYLLQIMLPICCLLFNVQYCSTDPSLKVLANSDERTGKLGNLFFKGMIFHPLNLISIWISFQICPVEKELSVNKMSSVDFIKCRCPFFTLVQIMALAQCQNTCLKMGRSTQL